MGEGDQPELDIEMIELRHRLYCSLLFFNKEKLNSNDR